MGNLSQSFPTKRGREKYVRSLWDENGNSKGYEEYSPPLREHLSKGEPSKSNRQKYARRARRRAQ